MELLLLKTIDHLGEMGEIVEVAPGYARNYLLPKGFAETLSPSALQRVNKLKVKLEDEKKVKAQAAREMLAKVGSRESYTIMAEADETGQLFGSVTDASIADMLKAEGFEIDKKHVILAEPIKKCDIYTIDVKIGEDTAQFKLWVVAK
ncbi:MAG: 50S ribosomal protein L9 [Planctomycetota bacterium]